MWEQKTAYQLARSQVSTPLPIVEQFWQITHAYRSHFPRVLDLGAGDGRFALWGRFNSYEGVEIDASHHLARGLPGIASVLNTCAFEHKGENYSACIGNPPYVRHHDLNEDWRDTLAARIKQKTGVTVNRKCNLYIYFLFLALEKTTGDGLVSNLVPYEWVSRPSAAPLRKYIERNGWHVDVYRFSNPIFPEVLTTASISVIDKSCVDKEWMYYEIDADSTIARVGQLPGSSRKILPYRNRHRIWAMRGMSPGTQKVFTLTEGERIHFGLSHDDVLPCVTSLREISPQLKHLTALAFRKRYIEAGAKCWLIKSHREPMSTRLRAYLENVPPELRDTWTCNSRTPWYRYNLADAPNLLVSSGFVKFGPKILRNSINAHAIGSVCGIYSRRQVSWSRLREFLTHINFENRVVPHAKLLKKIEIRQLNAVLNTYSAWEQRNV